MRGEKSPISVAHVHSSHVEAYTSVVHVSSHACPSSSSRRRRISPTDTSIPPSSYRRQISPIQAPEVLETPMPPPTDDAFVLMPPLTTDTADVAEPVPLPDGEDVADDKPEPPQAFERGPIKL